MTLGFSFLQAFFTVEVVKLNSNLLEVQVHSFIILIINFSHKYTHSVCPGNE